MPQNSLLKSLSKPSLNWILIFIPVALVIRFVPSIHNDTILFVVTGLAIIPLAGLMGEATDQLARRTGEGIGGLLNATFGNAAELIIGLIALSKGMTTVVKASITGSIIGNILLVLGMSCLFGGWKFHIQKFNRTAARSSATLLLLASVALVIPSVFHFEAARIGGWTAAREQQLSLSIAIVLILTYAASLIFSLGTHKKLYRGKTSDSTDDEDEKIWPLSKALSMLVIATVLVAIMSEFLVGTIEAVRSSLGLTEVFVGVIIIAIVGNAAEHSTAIIMAMRNKMDLTFGIAVGSSLQIALFIAPVLVFASYAFGAPMNFEFSLPEIVAVVFAAGIAGQISGDGESNWLEGVQLLSVYVVLAILFYFMPAPIVHLP
ncbi:MAG: calcium/proton exchanger [Abditibacteriaceae bacterium]